MDIESLSHRLRWYGLSLLMVAAAAGITALVRPWLGPAVALFFFPAVVTAAIYGGYGPALLSSAMSTFVAALFVVPPQTRVDVGSDDVIRFAVLTGVALTIAGLSAARRAAQEAERASRLVIARQGQELAVREERIRVSRDLHDGVLQGLTGIRLEIHDIADAAAQTSDLHHRLLAAERALAIEQRELRRLIENLNPKGPAAGGGDTIDAALRQRAERLSAEWQTPITTHVLPSDRVLPAATAQAVEFMCQEAAINALKHAHPSRVSIAVAASDNEIRLTVVDDGRGFPFSGRLDHDALTARDLGPVTLRERAASLHGRLAVESGRRGSRVEITLPLAAAVVGSRIPDQGSPIHDP
jgi:signal transduction histidine kinase